MKKKILVALSVVICVAVICIFVFAGKGYSPSVGRFLSTENTDMIIIDNSPIVMSVRNGNENAFEKYETGDKILVVHDGILESYPAQTGVYFSAKLADGHISNISETVLKQLYELGWTALPVKLQEDESGIETDNNFIPELFDINTVMSHATFDMKKIALVADNAEFMTDEELYHFPVFGFDSYEKFNKFLADYDMNFDNGYSNADDFRKGFEYLNEEYFSDHSVILVPYYTGSGNVTYEVEGVYTDGEICRLNIIEHKSGQGGTAVVTSYITAVGIEKNFLAGCSSFDAVLLK